MLVARLPVVFADTLLLTMPSDDPVALPGKRLIAGAPRGP